MIICPATTVSTQEIREQTARYIVENGKSATSMAEEMEIGTNTVCRWVRDYHRKNNIPNYAEEKGIKHKAENALTFTYCHW